MRIAFLLRIVVAASIWTGMPAHAEHAIAMHGRPALEPGFAHFPYVNPSAPKGGELRHARVGTFDSLNPFIVTGVPAAGVRDHLFESLLKRSADEPFTLYALVAEDVATPPDRSSVTFTLDTRARFSDGNPVTVDDVVFSWEQLKARGRPNHRTYYRKVIRVERPGPRQVRFVFEGGDREMPLIMGLMPILPRHWYQGRVFDETSFDAPVGSGPYVLETVDPGRSVVYRRNPDYWGAGLPVMQGQDNFAKIRYDYYRDANAAFEAFKAGLYDVHVETNPVRWATGYDFPAMAEGEIVRKEIPHGRPSGMYGFVYNTRRAVFADYTVRRALTYAFDFAWVNQNLFHGAYVRTRSFYDNSVLSSAGRPASAAERKLLGPHIDEVPEAILDNGWDPPESSGDGQNRANLRKADAMLREAGFIIRDGIRVNPDTGLPLAFEFMLVRPENEKLALSYGRALKRLGIEVRVRTVDSTQYEERRQTYDFDMIINQWDASLSPGNEQKFYFGSGAADVPGTRNYPGIRSAAVDAMIDAMLAADSGHDFRTAVRALDRALLSGEYVLPLFHLPRDRVAWRGRLARPQKVPLYGFDVATWWDGGFGE